MIIDSNDVVENEINGLRMFFLRYGDGIHTMRNTKKGNMDIREPEFAFIQRKETNPDADFIDAGANIGLNTLITASIIKKNNGKGHVYAIEPDPRNTALLQLSVNANGLQDIVSVHQIALSNYTGDLTFYTADATNLNSTVPTRHTSGNITVPCLTLTEFMKDKPRNALMIKSDTEGSEVEILEGGMELFDEKFPCKLLIEVHPVFYSKTRNFEKQLYNLLDRGFYMKYVASAAVAIPDKFKEHGYKPFKVFPAGNFSRGVYNNLSQDHAIKFSSHAIKQAVPNDVPSPKIVRSVLIERV